MKKHSLRFLLLTLIGILVYSCQNDDYFLENPKNETSAIDYSQGAKKLENPYTVENMRKAIENIKVKLNNKQILAKNSNSVSNLDVSASHYYIKFKPETEEQEGIIKRDTTMILSDYPLDYEFTDEYLDNRPELAEGEFPEYWVAVPIDKTLPSNVAYEILEELYIPEEDPIFNSKNTTSNKGVTQKGTINDNEDLLRHLLNEAYTLTGNEDDLLEEPKKESNVQEKWIFGSKWYPSGTLKIWDSDAGETTQRVIVGYNESTSYDYTPCYEGDYSNCPTIIITRTPIYENIITQGKYVPLVGAQVLMRQWFTVRQGITDQNGYFSTGSVRGKARYIIQWERYHYSIRSGWFGQAETRGSKVEKQDWNYNIKGGIAEYYGHIHRAAHNYFYGNIDGLRRPPKNGFLENQIKIAAYDACCDGRNDHYGRYINWLSPIAGPLQAWPTITLKLFNQSPSQIFGTTTHELAHSTHARHAGPITFIGSEKRMIETYANTIEWYLTTKYYGNYGVIFPRYFDNDLGYNFGYQNRYLERRDNDAIYTSFMVDLIDDYNQRIERGSLYPSDKVKNYSIQQIETETMRNKTFLKLKNDLKNRYYNSTENYLEELLNYWN